MILILTQGSSTYLFIGGSRGMCRVHAPPWDPILSFSHTFLPKSTRVGGPPPTDPRPLREILDPPLLLHRQLYKRNTTTQSCYNCTLHRGRTKGNHNLTHARKHFVTLSLHKSRHKYVNYKIHQDQHCKGRKGFQSASS